MGEGLGCWALETQAAKDIQAANTTGLWDWREPRHEALATARWRWPGILREQGITPWKGRSSKSKPLCFQSPLFISKSFCRLCSSKQFEILVTVFNRQHRLKYSKDSKGQSERSSSLLCPAATQVPSPEADSPTSFLFYANTRKDTYSRHQSAPGFFHLVLLLQRPSHRLRSHLGGRGRAAWGLAF